MTNNDPKMPEWHCIVEGACIRVKRPAVPRSAGWHCGASPLLGKLVGNSVEILQFLTDQGIPSGGNTNTRQLSGEKRSTKKRVCCMEYGMDIKPTAGKSQLDTVRYQTAGTNGQWFGNKPHRTSVLIRTGDGQDNGWHLERRRR